MTKTVAGEDQPTGTGELEGPGVVGWSVHVDPNQKSFEGQNGVVARSSRQLRRSPPAAARIRTASHYAYRGRL